MRSNTTLLSLIALIGVIGRAGQRDDGGHHRWTLWLLCLWHSIADI